MFQTSIGAFDGNSWEIFCQKCFRLKYEQEGYQPMPDINGDYGIEGFTRTGIVFQCYCPDNEADSRTLYEAQRDKITKDLGKLGRYEAQLKPYFENNLIKSWIFVTPKFSQKEILVHCQKKAKEHRALSLSIIDPAFDVFIHDLDNFTREIPIVVGGTNALLDITPEREDIDDSKRLKWKNTEIPLVENANRKNKLLLNPNIQQIDFKVDCLTDITIQQKLEGDSIINRWQTNYPSDYETFLRVVDLIEREVVITCMQPCSDNMQRYKDFKTLIYNKLKLTFGYLSEPMLLSLSNKVVSDWILNCPIDFE